MVKGGHAEVSGFIHKKDDKRKYEGGYGYHDRTCLQFLPGRPGNLMHEFIIGFSEKYGDLIHGLFTNGVCLLHL